VTEAPDRLPEGVFYRLCDALGEMEVRLCGDPEAMKRLTAIRKLYEPHAFALAEYLKMPLPLWVAEPKKTDQWKTVSDLRVSAGFSAETARRVSDHVSALSTNAAHLHEDEEL